MEDLISLVAELKEDVERLRTIIECEQELDWLDQLDWQLPDMPERKTLGR